MGPGGGTGNPDRCGRSGFPHLVGCPAVVDLAGRAAVHLVAAHYDLGQLVAGDMGTGLGEEVGVAGVLVFVQGQHCTHLAAPTLRRPAAHDDVGHGGMAHQGLFDLFGEDLLASRVDGGRVAAVEDHGAVDRQLRPVAGDGHAFTPYHGEGGGCLVGIAEVAEGEAAALGEPSEVVLAGYGHPCACAVDDRSGLGGGERTGPRLIRRGGDLTGLRARFR